MLLTGDVYLRLDDFASSGLVRALNLRGLCVVIDPMVTLIEHLQVGAKDRLQRLESGPEGVAHRAYRAAMQFLRALPSDCAATRPGRYPRGSVKARRSAAPRASAPA